MFDYGEDFGHKGCGSLFSHHGGSLWEFCFILMRGFLQPLQNLIAGMTTSNNGGDKWFCRGCKKLASTWGWSFIWLPRQRIICDIHWPGTGGNSIIIRDGGSCKVLSELKRRVQIKIKSKLHKVKWNSASVFMGFLDGRTPTFLFWRMQLPKT